MIAFLLEWCILYGLLVAVPLLGVGCVVWYVLTHGIALAIRPRQTRKMKEHMEQVKRAQKENDALYHKKEVDKIKEQWENTYQERLNSWELLGLVLVVFLICWSLYHV